MIFDILKCQFFKYLNFHAKIFWPSSVSFLFFCFVEFFSSFYFFFIVLHFIDFHLDILKVFDDACVGGSLAPIFCLLVTSTTRPLGLASLCDAHPPTLKTMRKKNFARQTSSPFLDPYLVAVRPLKLSNKKIERT